MSERRAGDLKYTPLVRYLQALPADQDTVTLSLAEIAAIIGGALPPGAHTPGFWAASSSGSPLLRQSGWRATLTWQRTVVTFRRRLPVTTVPAP